MEEKRSLVWLSAVAPDLATKTTLVQEWQLIPLVVGALLRERDIPSVSARVGVFDFSALSSGQLNLASNWLEALQVEHWVAVLDADQVNNPVVCGLVNRYCRDYHTLPVQPERLRGILGHLWGMSELLTRISQSLPLSYQDFALEGDSLAIIQARERLRRFAHTEEPVLIYGENGTGKETAAKFIHANSSRSNKPLVIVNCAALPPTLTQNELFGHEKGSFTHAMSVQKGRIETADGGTLLLVGIDELVSEQQSAILRFLEEGKIERIGGSHPIKVDVRLIITSTKPLEQLVADGRFRSDVFYRLGSLHVMLPPLRDRREDIPLLANRILSTAPLTVQPPRLSENATICLARHPWPGNLRELQNRLRQPLLFGENSVIEAEDLGFAPSPASPESGNQGLSLDAFRSRADRQAICVSLALAENNVSAAARLLNISRVSLYRLMEKYQLSQRKPASPSNSD